MRHSRHPRRRRGFTLVELLVACALTVLIMAVLATAFSTGMTTFSHLKSTVGLSEQLRSAETILRRDLEAVHLEDADGLTIRVSDPRLATSPWTGTGAKGYFEVLQATAPGGTAFVQEGIEDGVYSFRATDQALFFTSKLSAASAQETYTGDVPPPDATTGDNVSLQSLTDFTPTGSNAFVGAWSEVGIFLVPTSVFTTDDGTPGTRLPLYNLIRKSRVLATAATSARLTYTPNNQSGIQMFRDNFPDASISTRVAGSVGASSYIFMNDAVTLKTRTNRLGYVATNAPGPTEVAVMPDVAVNGAVPRFSSIKNQTSSSKDGTDVLVTNVVSMQIRVMDSTGKFKDRMQSPNPVASPELGLQTQSLAAVTYLPATVAAEGLRLDTASPIGVQMRAVQIKLRVYDTKNHLTRQMTMTFDL